MENMKDDIDNQFNKDLHIRLRGLHSAVNSLRNALAALSDSMGNLGDAVTLLCDDLMTFGPFSENLAGDQLLQDIEAHLLRIANQLNRFISDQLENQLILPVLRPRVTIFQKIDQLVYFCRDLTLTSRALGLQRSAAFHADLSPEQKEDLNGLF